MRHSDINLTMSRYSHVLVEQEGDAVAALPDLATAPCEALTVAVGQDRPAETGDPRLALYLALCLALSGGPSQTSADSAGRNTESDTLENTPGNIGENCNSPQDVEAAAGFEPATYGGFANRCLEPLGYAAR